MASAPVASTVKEAEALRQLTIGVCGQEDQHLNPPTKRGAPSQCPPEGRTPHPRKRGVRFSDETADALQPTQQTPEVSAAAGSTLTNLGLENDICRHLQENVCEPRDGSEHCDHYLGYLELPQQSKHLFYCPGTPRIPSQPATEPRRASSISVAEVLQCLPAEQFELDQQLHLAHRLAVATLQFNATPWLCDSWRTEDVFVLGSNQPNMSKSALQTLHFQASCPTNIGERATAPEPDSPTSPTESPLELLYGIRNAPLFSLGVALLEVSQQRPVHFRGVNPENEVIAVRRLARGSMRLGPRYKEIVRRCLECDFGYGNDLEKSELQSAVYGQVVWQLEEMMKKLCLD